MKFIMSLRFIISSSSWLVFIRHMPFSLLGPKIFLSNTNSLLIMVSFNIHVSRIWPLHALMVWTRTEVPIAKIFDFWLVINEGPPFVDGHCRVPLRGHKSGDIQKDYCSSKPATLLPFAR
jgi:hypothetical protein